MEPAADGHAPPGLPDDFQEEFDSPATIEALASALSGLGHDVSLLGDGRPLIERLLARPPDLIFNFAEGHGIGRSREARVPALLEMLGIPYTGSDPLTMAVTLDKDCAKRLAASAGIAVPQALVLDPDNPDWKIDDHGSCARRANAATLAGSRRADAATLAHFSRLPYPVLVKPAWEGSSKGIRQKCLVKSAENLPEVVEWLQGQQRQPVLVEEYVPGDELTVGVLGNDPPEILGIMRVTPVQPTEHFVYSLEIKRDYRRLVKYECPARLSAEVASRVKEAALTVFNVLGCRDVSRIDFRVRDGIPYFLEVNPLPGLNPQDSDLVIMARLLGWGYERLIEAILGAALHRLDMVPEKTAVLA